MIKKIFIFLVLMFFIPFMVSAEELKMEWQTSWGGDKYDYFDKVLETKDDNILVFGGFYSSEVNGITNKGGNDVLLSKYDREGNLLWQTSWGGEREDSFSNIIETNDGSFIMAGASNSTDIEEMPNKNPGNYDIVIVKFDKDGNLLWQRGWGGNDYDTVQTVFETVDGDYIVVGYSESTDIDELPNKGYYDAIMLKYDKDGNMLWQKSWGGNGYDSFDEILLTDDGGFVVVGSSSSTDIDGLSNKGYYDAIMLKYDKDGNMLWQKSWGGNEYDCVYDVLQMENGDLAVIGYYTSTDISGLENIGDEDVFVLKYDKEGNLLWQTSWGNSGRDYLQNIIHTSDDGFVIFGDVFPVNYFDVSGDEPPSYGAIVKIDKNGNIQWEKILLGNGMSSVDNVFETNDHNLIVYGYFSSTDMEGLSNNGTRDSMILKYDKDGNLLWQKSWGGNEFDYFNFIFETNNDDLLVFGNFWSTNIENLSNNGKQDLIILRYNKYGELLWEYSFGGNKQEYFDDIYFINDNEFILFSSSYSNDIDGILNNGDSNVNIITKYSIEYDLESITTENGNFTLKQQGKSGIISPLSNKGYELDKIVIKDTKGNILDLEITKLEDGTYSFPLYTDVNVEVLFKEEVVNPKTGVVNFVTTLLVGFVISFIGYTLVKKNCYRYDL